MRDLIAKINKFLNKFQRVPLTEKIFFIQNLQVMIKAGLSLSQALNALGRQTTNQKLKEIIIEAKTNVEKGQQLSQNLANHHKVFSEVFTAMIAAGEASGNLEGVLKQLAIQMKKDHEIISKVKGALTYPLVVLCAMVAMGLGMMIFVVPKITSIFEEMNAQLPLPTRILIGFSKFITQHGILSFLIVAVIIGGFIYFIRNPQGKMIWHKLILKMPLAGPIIKKINLARIARTLNSLIKTDIPIVEAFRITSRVVGNLVYRERITEASEKIKSGSTITEVLSKYPELFPPVATQMIDAGEQSGSLDELLEELSDFYESDVHDTMANLSSIIEPIMILVMGVAVGAMAIAIIMPMYSLSEQI